MKKQLRLSQTLLCCLMSLSAVSSQAAGVVISQIYGGAGNTYNRDYVELFNASSSAVNITGWSVQYASATGTGNFSGNGVTVLNGTLQPGQYHLVALSSAAAGTALPSQDATGTSNLSACFKSPMHYFSSRPSIKLIIAI